MEGEVVGRIYKLSKQCTNMVYIGQTCQPLANRLAVHNSFAKRLEGAAYSAYRLYRLDGPLIIEEIACISKLDGESDQEFKRRLSKLEHDYIKGTPHAVNKYGAKYDKHGHESNRCGTCGQVFSTCYMAKQHEEKKKSCQRYMYENACKALQNMSLDLFT
jgi:hypothetical protein